MCFRRHLFLYSFLDSVVHVPPELCDMGIGITPCIHQRFEFFFRDTHFKRAHSLERTD